MLNSWYINYFYCRESTVVNVHITVSVVDASPGQLVRRGRGAASCSGKYDAYEDSNTHYSGHYPCDAAAYGQVVL